MSPKTPTKAYRLSVSKCCLICNVNLTANNSFYRTTYAGLSEKLEKLLRTSIEPRDTKYVCKSCFRRAELLIKKRNVLDSLDSEFQEKFLSSAGSDTLKRLSKKSPQRPIKKAKLRQRRPRPIARSCRSEQLCLAATKAICKRTPAVLPSSVVKKTSHNKFTLTANKKVDK